MAELWGHNQEFSCRRHQMEAFSALLAICAGNSPVTGEFPAQRPETRRFAVFFDLRLNKRLSKQSRGWWFETPSCSLWRHCNVSFKKIECAMRLSAKFPSRKLLRSPSLLAVGFSLGCKPCTVWLQWSIVWLAYINYWLGLPTAQMIVG